MTQHAILSASTFYTFTQHIKVTSLVKGGTGSAKQKWFELSKCVYLASMGVKIEHTVGGQNQDFLQNAYLMVRPAET